MRFEIKQRFAATAPEVDAAYADPELYGTLVGLPKLGGIQVLEHRRNGEQVHLSIRYAFTGDLPPAVTAVVDPHRLTWVQESDHDLTTGRATFRMVPDHYPDRLASSGAVRVLATDTGTQRVISGDLRVKALLVSGRVEQAIVSGLAEYLEAEAPAVDRFLAR